MAMAGNNEILVETLVEISECAVEPVVQVNTQEQTQLAPTQRDSEEYLSAIMNDHDYTITYREFYEAQMLKKYKLSLENRQKSGILVNQNAPRTSLTGAENLEKVPDESTPKTTPIVLEYSVLGEVQPPSLPQTTPNIIENSEILSKQNLPQTSSEDTETPVPVFVMDMNKDPALEHEGDDNIQLRQVLVPISTNPIKTDQSKDFPKIKPKTFFFKNTNNISSVIKTALKQCNFPKGTRLVRSVVEKGKSMYRIELPQKSNMETLCKENKLISKKKKLKTTSEQQENNAAEVPNESGAVTEGADKEGSTEVVLSKPDNQTTTKRKRTYKGKGKWKPAPIINFQPTPELNAIVQKFKMRRRRRMEILKRRREMFEERMKERMKRQIEQEIRDRNHVMSDALANEYLDKLFFKAGINCSAAKLLFIMDKYGSTKRSGRRYPLDEKVFALSLHEYIGKTAYGRIENVLPLPNRKTLNPLINNIPFLPGLNSQLFKNLKKSVTKLEDSDKYCTLMFREFPLSEEEKADSVAHKRWLGCSKKSRPIGDRVLMLMLRGVSRDWRQPIAHFVNTGDMQPTEIVHIIKSAVQAIVEIGLKPLAAVFNAKNSFIEAINLLKFETEIHCLSNNIESIPFGFMLENLDIIPILNPLHLLTDTRDAMLTYDIEFIEKEEAKIASWEHVLQLYACDQTDSEKRLCPRLKDTDVLVKKIAMAKTHNCSHVFSQRVSAIMRKLATLSVDCIDAKATETADFLFLMDQLLDSVTGSTTKSPQEKPLKCLVTEKSKHLEFWNSCVEIMSKLKYIGSDLRYAVQPLTVGENWVATLLGYVQIVDRLFKEGVKRVPIRHFTSEPLDKFIASLHVDNGQKCKNPTYYYFISSLRTLVMSNGILNNCFSNENDNETPLDINKDYIYDEGAPNEDEHNCCNNKECSDEV